MNPIVIMDSGVGGLTIFDAIQQRLPSWPLVYFLDNEGFPYGEKSEPVVIQRICRYAKQLYDKCHPALLVVACNTASTLVLPALRKILPIPVVGVIPAIKPAASLSANKCIGLLATPGTVKRTYVKELIATHAPTCHVACIGSSELVLMAESRFKGEEVSIDKIATILQPFLQLASPPDYIVLGCTHFPLLTNEFYQCLSHLPEVTLVDPSQAIAKHVASLSTQLSTQLPRTEKCHEHDPLQQHLPVHGIFTSAPLLMNNFVQAALHQKGLGDPLILNLDMAISDSETNAGKGKTKKHLCPARAGLAAY